MFDHVTIRVSNRAAAQRFYDTVLATLEVADSQFADPYVVWGDFSLAQADAERPVTRKLHIAFFARSGDSVDEFWRVGAEAGYQDDGSPGPRPQYSEDYYGGFLLDPDGNSVEAVHCGVRRPAAIDHFAGDGGSFSVVSGDPTEGLHVAFDTQDNGTVEAFHRAATEGGYRDDGPAGERAIYHDGYYGAFVVDPDGNSVEVVNHNGE